MLKTFKRTRMCNAVAVMALSAISIGCTNSGKPALNTQAASLSASQTVNKGASSFNVEYERFTLENGLTVLLHVDRSDPVAAVALTAHVGSAREKEGRTGFAHLFEHLLFLESENLGKGGLDKLSARIGGSGANGSTSRDSTNYYQTVPIDALEKMIWAEADKLGFFINTVTDPVLAKEKQVVKNEKRQRVDNRAYGHNQYVIDKNLYPAGHPYSWQVIGSLDDLQNATLADVKAFFNTWYVPNNVVLTIAGDIDVAQTKSWVKKYFAEIPAGETISKLATQPAKLDETVKRFHIDNFAQAPLLTMVWPTVPQYHDDYYALQVLSQYLGEGKNAPLNKVLIDEKKLTSNLYLYGYDAELAGQLQLQVMAFNSVDLNAVYAGIEEAFARFEKEGIAPEDLARIKAGQETEFYQGLSSVLGKGFQLAQYEIFAGNAAFISQDVKKILGVSQEDVMRVYRSYLKDKPYVATSFVPKGNKELVLAGSTKANVVEELIVEGAEEAFDASIAADYERTPSSFDRTKEPAYGASIEVTPPQVWQSTLSSGIDIAGISNDEVPLVAFEIKLDGGMLLDPAGKAGTANLLAELLLKGTATKTPKQLEQEIQLLGATLETNASETAVTISGSVLSKHYDALMALVAEVLLSPRFDEAEFALAKDDVINQIEQIKANPNAIAAAEFKALLYGNAHPFAQTPLGEKESVTAISLDDIKAFYRKNISPSLAKFHVVGDIEPSDVKQALVTLNSAWVPKKVSLPNVSEPSLPETSQLFFYDVPDAKQSVLYFGHAGLKATHSDAYLASVMNYRLGGGGFASQLMQELRENKGYTYGIRSSFSSDQYTGEFIIKSAVRSNVTLEATQAIQDILLSYGNGYSSEDLEVTKGFTLKSGARAFETLGAKLNMVDEISDIGLPNDYVLQQQAEVKALTVDDVKRLYNAYVHPGKMIYLVVGDKATQFKRLEALGLGTPVLLNP
ncbi:peptidase, M16 family protein [Alteromonas mediterranea MED64]|uniref:M16 family metallopeptidase n=1 Tax=Alteromonas mediterranea TaxID=314275 RepID=UPI000355455B|nr:pitrilysin family protein [Alteromonas mediterranea]AGP82426.1 peptidase, M16 family protein [Alteromonas mediterranea MED64]